MPYFNQQIAQISRTDHKYSTEQCTSAQPIYYSRHLHRLHNHLQVYFCHLSHKMLCILWDPIMFTSMEYVAYCELNDKNRHEDDYL